MNPELRKVQLVQLEMLREIDCICKKYNIQYSLFAGTALGAVRHSGFIPWDDDLDIVMIRSEYERFIQIATYELSERYFLQEEYSEHWPMHFTKLRKNNTAYLERFVPKDTKMHQGVYIDIFPCDNLSSNPIIAKIQFFASKVVIAKNLYKRGYLTESFTKRIFMQVCRFLPSKPFIAITKLCKNTSSKMVHTFFGASSKLEKSIYKREWITETINMRFEDREFPVSKHYDELLTTMYGDYMTPLPESDRVFKVHGEIVDLNKSYTEYLEIQKDLRFTIYTRSIR